MQRPLILLVCLYLTLASSGQIDAAHTGYNTRITTVKWMPDGNAVILGIVKYHQTNHQAPFFSKVFLFDLKSKEPEFLFDDGSNLTPSPDGKKIAFLKRSDLKKAAIYLYDIESRKVNVLKTDTLAKNALTWSPDGKYLAYNISHRKDSRFSTVDICILHLSTKVVKHVTANDRYKSYAPEWSPNSKLLVYYLEKNDERDQIWLTDFNGSFHTNLTRDSITHNYFPSWIDLATIIYTQSPDHLMTMNIDGTNKQKIEGINASPVSYNAKTRQFAYIKSEAENKLVIFNWKVQSFSEILDGTTLLELF